MVPCRNLWNTRVGERFEREFRPGDRAASRTERRLLATRVSLCPKPLSRDKNDAIMVGNSFGASVDMYLLDIDTPLVRTVKSEPSAVVMRVTLRNSNTPAGPDPLILPPLQLARPCWESTKTIEARGSGDKPQGDLYQTLNGPKFPTGW